MFFLRDRQQDSFRRPQHFGLPFQVELADHGRRHRVQFVVAQARPQAGHAQGLQARAQALQPSLLAGDAPHVLRPAGVGLEHPQPGGFQGRLHPQAALGQPAHRPQGDGKELDPLPPQFLIARPQVSAVAVMDRPAARWKAQRRVHCHHRGLRPLDLREQVGISVNERRFRPPSTQETQARRTGLHARQVNADDYGFPVQRMSRANLRGPHSFLKTSAVIAADISAQAISFLVTLIAFGIYFVQLLGTDRADKILAGLAHKFRPALVEPPGARIHLSEQGFTDLNLNRF